MLRPTSFPEQWAIIVIFSSRIVNARSLWNPLRTQGLAIVKTTQAAAGF